MNPVALETNSQPNIFDGSNLAALKRLTKQSDPAAIKAAAQQFEALFVQMMMKSMRDATPKDEAMGTDQQRMYESLLDQQLSQVMATRGGGMGLASVIEKQLTLKQPDPDAVANSLPAGLPLNPPAPAFSLAPKADKGFVLPAVK